MIPAKGTTNRRVLDFLHGAETRTKISIYRGINDVPRPNVDRAIDAGIEAGHIKRTYHGYQLTESAEQDIASEVHAKYREFKPMPVQPSWTDRLLRPGAGDFMEWRSKY